MTQKDLVDRLRVLAKMCGYQLTPEEVGFYDRGLRRFGYELAVRATEEAILERKGNERMPSIGDLMHRCAPQATDQDSAIEISGRILSAISRYGYARAADALDWIGEIGGHVVEFNGGWAVLCQSVREKDLTTWKAQLREQAASVIRRQKAGVLSTPPSFAKLPQNQKLTSLIGTVLGKGEEHANGNTDKPTTPQREDRPPRYRLGEGASGDAGTEEG